ncbi:hypothetical protein R1sor_018961 [Riccia sorocarpa]|uniref:Uncharacterized protein n=1 Tax=Riccia sorocarpa TaxID=122646 RepID=A0ABD3IHE8_9MARC
MHMYAHIQLQGVFKLHNRSYHDRHRVIRDAVKTAINSGLLKAPSKRNVETCIAYPNYAELDVAWSKKVQEAAEVASTGIGETSASIAATSAGVVVSANEEAISHCRVRQDTVIVNLRQFHIEKPGKENWLSYQIRPLNEHFVDLLSEKLLARKQPWHNHIFIVLVDPEEGLSCPQDFDMKRVNEYKYYVLGGNHTATAKLKAYKKFTIPNETFLLCSCFVYVGLTLLEARIIATDDNADQQFRLKMSNIQKIEYWHQRFLRKVASGRRSSRSNLLPRLLK